MGVAMMLNRLRKTVDGLPSEKRSAPLVTFHETLTNGETIVLTGEDVLWLVRSG